MKTSVKVVEMTSEMISRVLSALLRVRSGKHTPHCCFNRGDLIRQINPHRSETVGGIKPCHQTNQHLKCWEEVSTTQTWMLRKGTWYSALYVGSVNVFMWLLKM